VTTDRAFEDLWIWDRVGDRLPWYYAVATNRLPAKYLIARRVSCEVDLHRASEEELWDEHARATDRFLQTWQEIRAGNLTLSSISPQKPHLLDLSIELVGRMLRHCNFCRWKCGVDRTVGTKHGTCQLESTSRVSSYFRHRGEELVFRGSQGSGTIFFTSCNLRCSFCVVPSTFLMTNRGPVRMSDLFDASGFDVEHAGGHVRFPQDLFAFRHDGRRVKVTKIFRHNVKGNLVVVEPVYAPPLLVTPDHEILVTAGPDQGIRKIRADDLTLKHRLILPRLSMGSHPASTLDVTKVLAPLAEQESYATSAQARLPFMVQAVELSRAGAASREIGERLGYNPAYVRNLRSRIRRHGYPAGRKKNSLVVEDDSLRLLTEKRFGIPLRLGLNEDLAEFLGYYCAEGHVTKIANRPASYNVVLSFGHHERQLVRRAAELLRQIFRLEPRIVQRRTTVTVECTKSSLGLLLHATCGSRSHEKRAPRFLFQAPPNVVESFLRAFQKGDGCETNGYISLNTVSEGLAMDLYALYLRLGHLPSFNVYEPPPETMIEGRRVRQSTLYYVKINAKRMREKSWAREKQVPYRYAQDHFDVPILRISRRRYAGPVFNVEVDDPSHTYLANFIAIGNCQNGDISRDKDNGLPITPRQLAAMAWQLRMEGCHNINWVGGEPTIHLHTIIEAISHLGAKAPDRMDLARARGVKTDDLWPYPQRPEWAMYRGEFNAPMLWNSNFFMSPETMRILRPLMDVWLPDFKFGNDKCSIFLARTPWYWETVSRNHQLIYDWGEDMVIRHLVMPDHVECCTKPVLKWIAEHTPKALVNVMDQYHPDSVCNPRSLDFDPRYRSLARRPYEREILEAYEYARDLGLRFEEVTFEKARVAVPEWARAG